MITARKCGCSMTPSAGAGFLVEVCEEHGSFMAEFLGERAVFDALLASGVSLVEANRIMIERIESRRAA